MDLKATRLTRFLRLLITSDGPLEKWQSCHAVPTSQLRSLASTRCHRFAFPSSTRNYCRGGFLASLPFRAGGAAGAAGGGAASGARGGGGGGGGGNDEGDAPSLTGYTAPGDAPGAPYPGDQGTPYAIGSGWPPPANPDDCRTTEGFDITVNWLSPRATRSPIFNSQREVGASFTRVLASRFDWRIS